MISYFVKHPTAANLVMMVLLAAGAMSLNRLRRATFPDYLPTEVQVTYPFPGATAEEVEETICRRVESALESVRYVEEIRSDARPGLAVITMRMEEQGDPATFKDEIQTGLDGITGFPQDVEDPITRELGTTELVLKLLVAGPMNVRDLKAYSEDVKSRLQKLPEVASVTLSGFSDHQFRVELSAQALMQQELDVNRVAQMLTRQNLNLPAGTIHATDRELVIRMVEQRRGIDELRDLVITASSNGAEVRLGDIAKITDTFEHQEDQIVFGGQRAALLVVEKTRNQDTIRAASAVKQFLQEERARMPDTMKYLITSDLAPVISGRLNLLYKFFWQGALLVFLVMWLFFNAKLSFWVVMSIPISVSGALFLMPLLGITIDMFSMVAILMALGILMDDGIVIAENVAAHAARGKPACQAAIDGTTEVASGVISSFLTTACVLGPLIFIGGEMGRVIRVVPIMLLIVLVFSLIEAFFVLPAHLAHSLQGVGDRPPNRFRRRFDAAIDWVRDMIFGRIVDAAIRWRYLWIGTTICLFLASIGLLSANILKYQGFPAPDGNWLEARLTMSQGTTFDRTEKTVRRIADGLQAVDDQISPTQPSGQRLVRAFYVVFGHNLDAQDSGAHVATVVADLLDAELRTCNLNEIIQRWAAETERLPDVAKLAITEPAIVPSGRPIDVRMRGEDLHRLQAAAEDMKDWFSQWRGVRNLSTDLDVGKEELQVRMRTGAAGLGVDATDIARQLRSSFQGVTAAEMQVGDESYDVDVSLQDSDQNSLTDLDYHHITLSDGSQSPLSTLVDVQRSRGWSSISRVNNRRTVSVRGDTDPNVVKNNTLFSQFSNEFLPEFQQRFPEIEVVIDGENKKITETQQSIAQAGAIGIVGVFVLLSFQFRSYIEPLVVMVAIPLAFIGVILGHLLLGYDLTITAIFGFVSLSGVVINDSILLVLFLKKSVDEGNAVDEAARQACRQRFRAIMLTSLTTIAGLTPLLVEQSFQARLLIPMAISIAFGLAASTVLVLLVVPCLYVILADFGHLKNRDE